MALSSYNIKEVETYWLSIKDMSREKKIWLINKLSASLLEPSKKELTNKKSATERFVNEFAGKWNSNLSTDELLTAINNNRTCKDPISFDL